MKYYVLASAISLAVIMAGCTQKSTEKSETKITTPKGSTTITTETDVKKTGDHKTP